MSTIYKVIIETLDKGSWEQWFLFQPTIANAGKAIKLWKGPVKVGLVNDIKKIVPEILARINPIDWKSTLVSITRESKNCRCSMAVKVADVQIGLFSIECQKALESELC